MTGAGPTVFLIPSFKPTDILNDLVGQLRSASELPIVVVDDGSGPDHAEVFQRLKQIPGIRVLTNAINLGKGAALKHGMNHILVNFPDCVGVVTADADGQHTTPMVSTPSPTSCAWRTNWRRIRERPHSASVVLIRPFHCEAGLAMLPRATFIVF